LERNEIHNAYGPYARNMFSLFFSFCIRNILTANPFDSSKQCVLKLLTITVHGLRGYLELFFVVVPDPQLIILLGIFIRVLTSAVFNFS